MKKTWENCKKNNFRPDFGSFVPNLGPKKFFRGFYLYLMLEIFASYHCMIFQGKLMTQTKENGKKNSFGAWFGLVGPKFMSQIFFFKNLFCQSLDIMVSYHHVKYQKKIMIQSWENSDGRMDGQTNRREWFHRMLPG